MRNIVLQSASLLVAIGLSGSLFAATLV